MNTFEQDMKESYKKLKKDMKYIASLFPNAKKISYLGDNIMLIDFNSEHYNAAVSLTKTFYKGPLNGGWTTYKGVELSMRPHNHTNRISFTF